jgi:hypothetical protein
VKTHLTIAIDLHDDFEVIDLLDAAVSPDGLMSAQSWAFLET